MAVPCRDDHSYDAGMALRVDLNADLGELPGPAGAAIDDALLELVTSANVACGGHAGNGDSMRRLAARAASLGVAVGAHVSYPDREAFGRRDLGLPPDALLDSLQAQLDALLDAAAVHATEVRYIKAHGALYNTSVVNDATASLLTELALRYRLPLLTQHHGRLAEVASRAGVAVYGEFFADRAYDRSGGLRPRHEPAAVITDDRVVVSRVIGAVRDAVVLSHDGAPVRVSVDSVCVHGDTPGAVALARQVRCALQEHPVRLVPFVDQHP